MSLWLLLPATFGVSLLLTWAVRRYALARNLLDIPNARSSHVLATPRGGGLAIVVTYLATLLAMAGWQWLSWDAAVCLMGAGAWVAFVGFIDDHGYLIPAQWRLLMHFVGAFWILFWLPTLPQLSLFGRTFDLGISGYVLGSIALVWMLNLYNFMDGIDGLAGVEALMVGAGGAFLYVLIGRADLSLAPLLLAAAAGGFLVWNIPRARIFMGDAGSGFLGIMVGGLAFQAATIEPRLLWAWLILLGVFVVDATVTLLYRMLRRERLDEAHRQHAYQHVAQKYGAHMPVTFAVLVINLVWLLPWASSVALGVVDGTLAFLLAYAPLVLLALYFKAGRPESSKSF